MAETDRTLLVSDAERDRVIAQLREHAADGRLTMTDFEERVTEALTARTRADLRSALRDLPALEPVRPARDTSTGRSRPVEVPLRLLALGVVAAFAVVLLLQGAWWIVFPLWWLVPALMGGGRSGRRVGGCGRPRTTHGNPRRGGCGRPRAWDDVPGERIDDREVVRV